MADTQKTMKASSRLTLFIGLFFLIAGAVVIVMVNLYMRRQALMEAESKALEILDTRLAIHTYFTHQLKPKMFEFTEAFRPKEYFEPTWMSSTYAVREMGKYARQLGSKEYYYKECAINARSPENEADGYEREFLKKLSADADLVSHSGFRTFDGKPYFAVLRRGEAMEESCLRCHSDPQKAPKGLVDIYGPKRSFHRKIGDVAQAISIRIPLSAAYASADRFSLELSGLLLALFVLLFSAHYWVTRRWVFRPLDVIREKARLIAHDKARVGETLDLPKSRELKEFAEAFNALSRNLREHLDHLDDLVNLRTKQIRESEMRFRLLFENAPLGYQSLDQNGRFIEVNQAWLNLFGYQREEVIGRSFGDFLPPDWKGHFQENFPRFKAIGEILGIEFEMVKKDGSRVTVSIDGKISKDEQGHFLRTHCILSDISNRKAHEKALMASRKEWEDIFHAIGHPTMILDPQHRILEANQATLNLTHSAHDQLIGKKCHDVFHAKNTPPGSCPMEKLLHSGRIDTVEMEMEALEGTFLVSCTPVVDDSGTVVKIIHIATKITERKKAEEALQKSEEQFRFLAENMADIVWTADLNLRTTYVSPSIQKVLGFSDKQRKRQAVEETVTPESLKKLKALFAQEYQREKSKEADPGRSLTVEVEYYHKEGHTVWLENTMRWIRDASGNPIGIHGVSRDISERKRAEEDRIKLQSQLSQAQKMESVGRLAGGVAHDFNNMLGVILGHTELVMENLDPASPLRADLTAIHSAAQRSADLTRQLLAFARRQTAIPRPLDLNDTVAGMLKMLQRLIGEDIDLAWMPGANLWPVKMDPAQIDQILANLSVNARDAVGGVGKVTLETENITLDETYCQKHEGFVPGDYVMLAVSDDGCGMDAETLNQIFEPFFTTKAVGEGTGLGLSTVYGIVKQNNGFINVYSEPGQGATFKVYLPRTEEIEKAEKEPLPKAVAKGFETVLMVEDEASILLLGKTVLKRYGYTVLAAPTPAEAITLVETHDGPIHLLVTDVVMPEMNGKDLKRRARWSPWDLGTNSSNACLRLSLPEGASGMIDAAKYDEIETLKKGTTVRIRAIRANDKKRISEAFRNLEPESIYTRFFTPKKTLTDQELKAATEVDFENVVALVVTPGEGESQPIIAEGRYAIVANSKTPRAAEVAFTVEEDYQGQGIASSLLAHLVRIGRSKGLTQFQAEVLPRQNAMLSVFERSGLPMEKRYEGGTVQVTLSLEESDKESEPP